MLVDVSEKPATMHRVNRKCYSCGLVSDAYYFNHIESINKQSRLVEYWHCRKCYQELPEYKDGISAVTSNSMKKKFENDQNYVDRIKIARNNYYNSSNDNPRTMSRNEFIDRCVAVHGDRYDYSKLIYINYKTPVEIICKKHGSWWGRPAGHTRLKNGCPECNKEKITSVGENDISEWIKSVYNGTIIRSDRKLFGGLEIDIWLPDVKLGIEYHGAYFHSFNSKESTYHRNYHSMKSSLAHKHDIDLMQFVDLDIKKRPDVVKSMILNKLGLSTKIHARKCSVEKISSSYNFFNNNHFHGFVSSNINYALVYNGSVVCVLSLKDRKTHYEIMRFANLINICVVGGFQKLISAFTKEFKPVTIFTYVDRSFTTRESCYSKSGMNLVGVTAPGYRYWKSNILYNRISFQKHKLSNKLENFDDNLTESENMFNNGYRRLWDAGNLRYYIDI